MNPLLRDSFPSAGAGGPPTDTLPRRVDPARLAAEARQAMRAGRIPARPADQMWGGSGTGLACAVCGQCIDRREVEYELDFTSGSRAGAYHVHVACCMAWEAELS